VFTDFNEDWEKRLLTYNADVRDGYIDLAEDRPGLGAELNLDEIARQLYSPGNWLPLFKSSWESTSRWMKSSLATAARRPARTHSGLMVKAPAARPRQWS
jgi:hypothetical protein